jgi:2,4-dienoyl-CoA reductase-like NADH-dependent reductase (Old Yellow Enzyme family)
MAKLFENSSMGSTELKNRAVRSATWSGIGDERGFVTERAELIYGPLAEGGVGLIITGYQYVMTNGPQLPYMVGNYSDELLDGLTRLAQIAHDGGAKIVPQIVHTGAQANPKLFSPGDEVWAPSPITDPKTGKVSPELGNREISLLIEAYAAAAERSQRAGFDGVQLHGAHGYGINQFLSAAWNKRGDSYGGSLKKRYRFLAEVLEAVKSAVGDDFPVLIKLNAHDFLEGGLVPEESVQIGRWLSEDGIAAIEVSGGSGASPAELGPVRKAILKEEQEAYFADMAALFKSSVNVPIISVGGIRSLKTVDDMLADGKADFVSLARPLIREPYLINRWKSGDAAPATCISCNGCFETGVKGQGISCKLDREDADKQ